MKKNDQRPFWDRGLTMGFKNKKRVVKLKCDVKSISLRENDDLSSAAE